MAVLQAARAYVLGLSLNSAKSWGLNRAIFYAAAKKGFVKPKGLLEIKEIKIPEKRLDEKTQEKIMKTFNIFYLGDEMAYSVKIDDEIYFMIGNEIQSLESFYKQVERRFGRKFQQAWDEAIRICKSFNEAVLKSQRYFYEVVYKPRRDELASKWSEMIGGKKK